MYYCVWFGFYYHEKLLNHDKEKIAVLENRNTKRNKPENRLFGALFNSLMAEAISFALFQASAVQVQDHKTVAALVPKVIPQDKQISFNDSEKFRVRVLLRIGLIVVELAKGGKKKHFSTTSLLSANSAISFAGINSQNAWKTRWRQSLGGL